MLKRKILFNKISERDFIEISLKLREEMVFLSLFLDAFALGYFSLGCTLAIQVFAPVIAMTSILFLVMGDMTAALIGRSFGQSVCSIKIGPGGKKSVEGSTAMCGAQRR